MILDLHELRQLHDFLPPSASHAHHPLPRREHEDDRGVALYIHSPNRLQDAAVVRCSVHGALSHPKSKQEMHTYIHQCDCSVVCIELTVCSHCSLGTHLRAGPLLLAVVQLPFSATPCSLNDVLVVRLHRACDCISHLSCLVRSGHSARINALKGSESA